MSKKKKNPLTEIANYFKEVKAELKKVVWPTFKQIKNNTVIVIISLIFVGLIIWVLDLGFGATLGNLVELAGDTPPSVQDGSINLPVEDIQPQEETATDEDTVPIQDGGAEQPEGDGEAQQNEQ